MSVHFVEAGNGCVTVYVQHAISDTTVQYNIVILYTCGTGEKNVNLAEAVIHQSGKWVNDFALNNNNFNGVRLMLAESSMGLWWCQI